MTGAGRRVPSELSRRKFLAGTTTAALGLGVGRLAPFAKAAPAATVSVAKCDTYGAELVPTLDRMFDQIGGLGRLVKGKTVAVKLNLTGPATIRLGPRPAGLAHWVHPRMIGAVVHLMDRAGAHRIRLLEGGYATAIPLEEFMYQAGWDPEEMVRAGQRVEFENTNWLGRGKDYPRFDVPGGGLLFPSYVLNHSYRDCDVFVSLTKLKEHLTAGVTLTHEELLREHPHDRLRRSLPEGPSGRAPAQRARRRVPQRGAPAGEPRRPRGRPHVAPPRRLPHPAGGRRHLRGAAHRPRDHRRDRVDGRRRGAVGRGEGCHPGVLVAGTNCVNTDAVATAVMGFDPMAPAGTPPFYACDNFLELAEKVGLGSRDLGRIEVAGTPIREARFDFAPFIRSRRPLRIPPYPEKKRGS